MFDNISEKIKTAAKVSTVLGIIISVIYGFILMSEDLIFVGLLVMILGSLLLWTGSFVLYGVGEIISQLEYSNSNLEKLYDLLRKKGTEGTATALNEDTDYSVSKSVIREPIEDSTWICKKCHTENEGYLYYCYGCGKYKTPLK